MEQIKIDSRVRIDIESDDGFMLIITYHIRLSQLEFDYRFQGMPIYDHNFHLAKDFLIQIIEKLTIMIIENEVIFIEKSIYMRIIEECKKHISKLS
jgi:hypothetical protein